MPLVLAHVDVVRNPAHAWDDVEGERYHYPSKYQTKITTGEPFVYYRGVHRADGRRGPAQYVGAGRIGAIWADPERAAGARKAWYCAIEDYRRFREPVAAKIDGIFLEDIPRNVWRDGVRSLEQSVYDRILGLASARPTLMSSAPDASTVPIVTSNNLIIPPAPPGIATSSVRSSYRKSKQAKAVGDWAELVVLRYLEDELTHARELVHRAARGETPGWDIDYLDKSNELQRVEVKGTVSGAFSGVELTAAEMRAAKAHGSNFWLYLVAGCLTDDPKVQPIRDPARKIASGAWVVVPAVYSIRFGSAS
jgi:hypothetical protein